MNNHYLYLLINIGTILFPFLFSFEKRVRFVQFWAFLFPAIIATGLVFLVWDHFFTKWGVWGFNPEYVSGIYLSNLPLEEVLFFITVPYASIFIYAFLNRFQPIAPIASKAHKMISCAIMGIAAITLILNFDKAYTALNCSYALILLSIQLFVVKGDYMGRFYRFYLWHLIPFFLVNGILTGTGIASEVVWYNNTENLGIRLITIPVEDLLYSFSLMLMNIMIMEGLQKRAATKKNLQFSPQ